MRLEGKSAVVTGAAGGIGSAICRRFAHEGARVAALDLNRPKIGDLLLVCDMADDESVRAAADAAMEAGPPDIVVHTAAASAFGGTLETPAATFNSLYDVNVAGAARLAQAFAPSMRGRGGSIVLLTSINASFATPSLSAYAASKAGLEGLARTLALELAPDQIRVNVVAPASVDTPLLRSSFARSENPEACREANIRRHPLGRLGTPDDVANLVLFLASDESSWITGAVIRIDGGASVTRS